MERREVLLNVIGESGWAMRISSIGGNDAPPADACGVKRNEATQDDGGDQKGTDRNYLIILRISRDNYNTSK